MSEPAVADMVHPDLVSKPPSTQPWWEALRTAEVARCPPDAPPAYTPPAAPDVVPFLTRGASSWQAFSCQGELVYDFSASHDSAIASFDQTIAYVGLLGEQISGLFVAPRGDDASSTCILLATTKLVTATRPPITAGSQVWLAASNSEREGLIFGHDLVRGPLWKKEFSATKPLGFSFRIASVTSDGQLLVSRGGDLVSLSRRDGGFLWATSLGDDEALLLRSIREDARKSELLVHVGDEVVVLSACGEQKERIPVPWGAGSQRVLMLDEDWFATSTPQDTTVFFTRAGIVRTVAECGGVWTLGQGRLACLGTEAPHALTVKILEESGELIQEWDAFATLREGLPESSSLSISGRTQVTGLGDGKLAVILWGSLKERVEKPYAFFAVVYDSLTGTSLHEEIDIELPRSLASHLLATPNGEVLWEVNGGLWSWKVASAFGEAGAYPAEYGDFSNQPPRLLGD